MCCFSPREKSTHSTQLQCCTQCQDMYPLYVCVEKIFLTCNDCSLTIVFFFAENKTVVVAVVIVYNVSLVKSNLTDIYKQANMDMIKIGLCRASSLIS